MKIHHILWHTAKAAYCRYRIRIPSTQLDAEVSWSNRHRSDVDINVFHKHGNELLEEMHACRTVRVFDIVADHFEDDLAEDYLEGCRLADHVTANSDYTRKRIHEFTGRDALVIEDPYEMPEMPAKFSPEHPLRLCWFGNRCNLNEVNKIPILAIDDVPCRLEILTADIDDIKLVNPHARVIPWSVKATLKAIVKADLVVLPSSNYMSRSPNRAVTAIRLGRFVVAHDLASYDGMRDLMWIGEDIEEGIGWALHHQEEALRRVKAAQAYVRHRFSPEEIGRQWETFFGSIWDAGKNHSPATSMLT